MARSLNLDNVVRWIYWAAPGDLDGLLQIVKAKMEELGLKPGKRDNILPKNVAGDPSINVRGIVEFVNDCCEVEPLNADDEKDENKQRKAEKMANLDAQKKLCQLAATLSARCAAAGYAPPEAAPADAAPPLPAPTPDPKPLA